MTSPQNERLSFAPISTTGKTGAAGWHSARRPSRIRGIPLCVQMILSWKVLLGSDVEVHRTCNNKSNKEICEGKWRTNGGRRAWRKNNKKENRWDGEKRKEDKKEVKKENIMGINKKRRKKRMKDDTSEWEGGGNNFETGCLPDPHATC
jgi:hypothetical protein